MTTPSGTPSGRKAGVNVVRVLIVAVLAALVLWYAGTFVPRPRIAIVTSSDRPYWDLVIKGAEEAARQYDASLTVVRSKADESVQSDHLRKLADGKYAGIAVSPVNPATQLALLTDVAGKTTLLTFDSDSPNSPRLCFVGTDNYAAGRLCGQQVRQALPSGGEVIIAIGTLDKENAEHRRQGVIDELLDRPFDPAHAMDPVDKPLKGEQFTVAATLIDGGDPAKAIELASEALKQDPSVKCIVGLYSYNAPSALKALEQAGKLGQVQVVAFDADEPTLAGIEAGHIYSSIIQDQFGCGFHAVRILAENARGDRSGLPVFQRRTLPVEICNKANVAAIRAELGGGKVPPATPTTAPGANAAP